MAKNTPKSSEPEDPDSVVPSEPVPEPVEAPPSTSSGNAENPPETVAELVEAAPSTSSGTEDSGNDDADTADENALSADDQALLDQASIDLVAEMRSDMLRAQAELVNFR